MKNDYYLPSVWEANDENLPIVFSAIHSRYGRAAKDANEFSDMMAEYLTDRGVKHIKIRKTRVFYREDEKMYQEYLSFCKKRHAKPDGRDTFYKTLATEYYKKFGKI